MVTTATRQSDGPRYVTPGDRRLPWDAMGHVLTAQSHDTVADALDANGINYDVEVWDMYGAPRTQASVAEPTGLIHAPNLRTIVRPMPDGTRQVLAGSGSRYTPVQNRDAFGVADDLARDHGSKIVGAADFRHGGSSLLVVDINTPVTLNLKGGTQDVIDLALVMRNAHDGSSALTFALTSVRPACTNALRASLKGAVSTWKISHTPNAMERVALVSQMIRDTIGYREQFTAAAQAMADQAMTDREFDAIIGRIWNVPAGKAETVAGRNALEVQAQVRDLYQASETLDGTRGTLWGGLNAITEWYDWARPVRGEDKDATRAEGALDGPYARRKAQTWDLFLQAV